MRTKGLVGNVAGNMIDFALELATDPGFMSFAAKTIQKSAARTAKVPSIRHSEGIGNTDLSEWTGKTGELAKTSPVKIPNNAAIKSGTKVAGYDQISYKWNDGAYKYEARWHTKTPGAPAGQGNTWVVERITPGTSTGQKAITHILTGNGQWTTKFEWQQAITAYQNGVATEAQKALLQGGHWLAP